MGSPPPFREAFVGYSYVLAAIVAVAYALCAYTTRHKLVGHLGVSTRSSLYVSVAATTGVLLGFGITAVTIFLSLGPGRGLDLLRAQAEFRYVREVLMGAIYAFGVATVVMTAMIVFDTHAVPRLWLEVVAVFVLSLVFFRTWALVWLLNRLLKVALKDAGSAS